MDYKNIKTAAHDLLDVVTKTAKNFLDDYIDKKSNETKCACDDTKESIKSDEPEKKERTN